MCRSGSLRQEQQNVADNEKKDNRYEHVCVSVCMLLLLFFVFRCCCFLV